MASPTIITYMIMIKQQKHSQKTIIVAIVAVVVLAIVYFYFSGDPVPSEGSLQVQSASQADVVGTRVLNLLSQINSLHIDTSIFKGAVFNSLVDYTVSIPEVPVGRPNPFAPLSGVSIGTDSVQ